MKRILHSLVFGFAILLTSCSPGRSISQSYEDEQSNTISYQQFYDDLSPYGQWIDSPEFGYVWAPSQSGFRPYYSNGNWVYTNYGWTWVSNYNWGWATFHYGSWYHDNFDGWVWVPGYEWAPAWVSWRSNSNYYGWAPIAPRRRNGAYVDVRDDQWAFVPQQNINSRNINNYYINQQNNTTIINKTVIINNTRVVNKTTYQVGPRVTDVERVTRTRITPVAVKQNATPGNSEMQNGSLRIFKPAVKQVAERDEAKPRQVSPPRIAQQQNTPVVNNPVGNTESIKNVSPANESNQKPGEDRADVDKQQELNEAKLHQNSNSNNPAPTKQDDKPAYKVINDNNNEPQPNRKVTFEENKNNLNIQRQNEIERRNEMQQNNSGVNNNPPKQFPTRNNNNVNVQPVRKAPTTPAQNINRENNQNQRMNSERARQSQNAEKMKQNNERMNNQKQQVPKSQTPTRLSTEKQNRNKE